MGKLPPLLVKITKYGKSSFIISSDRISKRTKRKTVSTKGKIKPRGYITAKELLRIIAERFGDDSNAKLAIGDKSFFVRERADGRLSIPKKVNAHAGVQPIRIVTGSAGEKFSQTRFFSAARRIGHTTTKFIMTPVEDIDTDALSNEMFFALLKRRESSGRGDSEFYLRLYFLVEKQDNSVFSFLKSSGKFGEKLRGYEREKDIKTFVDWAFEEVFDILMRPYVNQIYLVKYTVTYSELLPKKERRV